MPEESSRFCEQCQKQLLFRRKTRQDDLIGFLIGILFFPFLFLWAFQKPTPWRCSVCGWKSPVKPKPPPPRWVLFVVLGVFAILLGICLIGKLSQN